MTKRLIFYLVCLLFFVMNFAVINGEIFRDALFLSTYPNSWLAYFFLASFLANVAVLTGVQFFLKKGYSSLPHFILMILIVLGVLGGWALRFDLYWFPFVYSIFLSFFYPVFSFLLFSRASSLFNVGDYKQYAPKLAAGASLGLIFQGDF